MFNVILFQPEIPPNTGNIIRLCANSGAQLHLIRPLGFELDDRQLRRAGLDYHEYANMKVHDDLESCLRTLPEACHARFPLHNPDGTTSHSTKPASGQVAGYLPQAGEETNEPLRELVATRRLFAFTTKGSHPFNEVAFRAGDAFLFGPESRGLPAELLETLPAEQKLRLPMLPNNRSLNLSNTVAIAVYEAWRQNKYAVLSAE
jgi:tRNA (cytidine/uridine-2'-O-)-methyltransferase